MQETLKIAVQKSGRLYEGSMKLLKECGIEVSNGNNQLRVRAANFPAEITFLSADKISKRRAKGKTGKVSRGEKLATKWPGTVTKVVGARSRPRC